MPTRSDTRFVTLLGVTALLLSTLAAAPVSAATHRLLCGPITAVVPPTPLTPGALTIGAIPLVITPGTTVSPSIKPGANLCLELTVDDNGRITGIDVSANPTTTMEVCSTIQSYEQATATTPGSITLLGRSYPIAPGADLPAALSNGEHHCVEYHLNGFGQIKDGQIVTGAGSDVRICGTVTNLDRASATSTGSITIAGRRFELARGAQIPASLDQGDDVCMTLGMNPFGQVSDGTIKAGADKHLELCGTVAGYAAATLQKTGSLNMAGRSFTTALGSSFPASVKPGADLCMELTLNAFGQVEDGQVSANVGGTLTVCGTVSAFTAATQTTAGRIVVGSVEREIAPGTVAPPSVALDRQLKMRMTFDGLGRVRDFEILDEGCGSGPAPTGTPAPSPSPTPDPSPSASPSPSGSVAPTEGPNGSPSPDPLASPVPSPVASEQPESCGPLSMPFGQPEPPSLIGGFEPDSIVRAASIAAVTAFPLTLLLLFAAVLAARSLRRRARASTTDSDAVTAVDETRVAEGTAP